MNGNDDRIDTLLRRNVEGQLADFDWAGLRRGIDSRLAGTAVSAGSWSRYGRWGAIAALVALTAGALIIAVIRGTESGPANGSEGEAKVTIVAIARTAGTAQVSFTPVEKPVRCEVRIHALDKPQQKAPARASWCVIVGREPIVRGQGDPRDTSDVLCLF